MRKSIYYIDTSTLQIRIRASKFKFVPEVDSSVIHPLRLRLRSKSHLPAERQSSRKSSALRQISLKRLGDGAGNKAASAVPSA